MALPLARHEELELEQIEIELLLEGIHRRYGFDFREYAPASLKRRLRRRMDGERVETVSALQNLIKASSGREALEQLLKHEIPVVLMDVSMPELDGFELAEMIREHPRCKETAIIFVSAVHSATRSSSRRASVSISRRFRYNSANTRTLARSSSGTIGTDT